MSDSRLISRSDRRRGFVPSRPPLSRLAVFRLGDDLHQLVWSIHHVVIDGWCLSVLLHEMLDIYEAIRRGREPEIETEPAVSRLRRLASAIRTTTRPKDTGGRP